MHKSNIVESKKRNLCIVPIFHMMRNVPSGMKASNEKYILGVNVVTASLSKGGTPIGCVS